MNDAIKRIRHELLALQDLPYHDFTCKLMPTVDPATVIGVRTPALRTLAKRLSGTPTGEAFLGVLPHQYYEENNLHAFLIEGIKDYEACVAATEEFLPYVNNWATCDSMSPKALTQRPAELMERIRTWIADDQVYTVRFAVGLLMSHYLDQRFTPQCLALAAGVQSEEYYANMMIAWYFATALFKQYDATVPYLERRVLGKWIHNKTIQKAIESYRVTDEHKAYLRTLREK